MSSSGGPRAHADTDGPAPRPEDAITRRAWSGAATLAGLFAVLGALNHSRVALDATGPWSQHGVVVQSFTVAVLVALAAVAIVWAVRGFRHREVRWLLYAGLVDATIFLIGHLLTL
ncbi:hypothetical protein MTQ01_00430 [Streptomyces sp. XM4193]|uniref:hypothetical protein n=1 Tax=Streptomyces sp. XM4193 TaxID=2929782 RepID=UPI001FF8BB04|nr:hypothetical protein [Streptomyces sp. XM4193]MCK1794518.1 hypothetical protein [Streptomyces sp. XM4193]